MDAKNGIFGLVEQIARERKHAGTPEQRQKYPNFIYLKLFPVTDPWSKIPFLVDFTAPGGRKGVTEFRMETDSKNMFFRDR